MVKSKRRLIKRMTQYKSGTTNKKADNKRVALKPGKRVSASGKVYTERRKNRSDVRKRL